MLDNEKIVDALDLLREQVQQANLKWIEPYQWIDENDNSLVCEFFGNGPQGKEPARFMIRYDDHKNVLANVICDDNEIFNKDFYNLFEGYKKYLELNNWLHMNWIFL